jgi:hypothetical protein
MFLTFTSELRIILELNLIKSNIMIVETLINKYSIGKIESVIILFVIIPLTIFGFFVIVIFSWSPNKLEAQSSVSALL